MQDRQGKGSCLSGARLRLGNQVLGGVTHQKLQGMLLNLGGLGNVHVVDSLDEFLLPEYDINIYYKQL